MMIRFGIVGAKGIAKKFARDIKYVDNAYISAVAARNEFDALKYQEIFQTEFAFSSYETMAKSDKIDAVYIATPHNFHHSIVSLFLENKKHVLVEKPIALNYREYDEMQRKAIKNNVLLMEAMWTLFLPATAFVKHLLSEKTLGRVKKAEITLGYQLPEHYPKDGRLLNKSLAGGSLLDLGIYPLSFYTFIKDYPIKKLTADAVMSDTGVDLKTEIEIIDEDDAIYLIKSSFSDNFDNSAKFYCENGIIDMMDFSRSKSVFVNNKEYSFPFRDEGFAGEIKSFVDNVMNKEIENQIVTRKHMAETMKLMDKVRALINLKYPGE